MFRKRFLRSCVAWDQGIRDLGERDKYLLGELMSIRTFLSLVARTALAFYVSLFGETRDRSGVASVHEIQMTEALAFRSPSAIVQRSW